MVPVCGVLGHTEGSLICFMLLLWLRIGMGILRIILGLDGAKNKLLSIDSRAIVQSTKTFRLLILLGEKLSLASGLFLILGVNGL